MFASYDDAYTPLVKDERFQLPLPDPKDCGLCFVTEFGHESAGHVHYLEHKGSDLSLCAYIVGGEGELEYRSQTVRLTGGDLVWLSLDPQTILRPVSHDLEVYFFYLDGAPVQSAYRQFTQSKTHVLHSFAHDKVRQLYEQLVLTTRDVQDRFARSKVLFPFLTDVLYAAERHLSQTYSPLVADTLRYCDAHGDTTVQDVAQALGYNAIYLERKFKAETGMTLKQHILQTRFDLACERLRTTELSVDEIARQLGYRDSMGLLFLFRKLAGCAPLAYRKRHAKR